MNLMMNVQVNRQTSPCDKEGQQKPDNLVWDVSEQLKKATFKEMIGDFLQGTTVPMMRVPHGNDEEVETLTNDMPVQQNLLPNVPSMHVVELVTVPMVESPTGQSITSKLDLTGSIKTKEVLIATSPEKTVILKNEKQLTNVVGKPEQLKTEIKNFLDEHSKKIEHLENESEQILVSPARNHERQTVSEIVHRETAIARSAPVVKTSLEHLDSTLSHHIKLGDKNLHIRLDPPALGELRVDIRMDKQEVFIRVQANSELAEQQIQTSLNDLRMRLSEQGLNLAGFSFHDERGDGQQYDKESDNFRGKEFVKKSPQATVIKHKRSAVDITI